MLKHDFVRHSLIVGILLGAFLSICMLILFLLGENPVGRYELGFLLPSLLIFGFLGVRFFRTEHNNGIMEGWKAATMSLIIMGAGAVVYAFFGWLLFSISNDALAAYKDQASLIIKDLISYSQTNEKQAMMMETQADDLRASINDISPTTIAFNLLFRSLAIGLFFTLIITLVARNEPKKVDS